MSLNKETQSNQILSHKQSLAEIVLCVFIESHNHQQLVVFGTLHITGGEFASAPLKARVTKPTLMHAMCGHFLQAGTPSL